MKKWQGYHIFYERDLNHLLLEGVLPIINSLQAKNLIERYFFIRYGEKGNHIRLRLYADASIFETSITPQIQTHFLTYFENYPSVRSSKSPDFYPNNSVQVLPYEPEIDRYGGEQGIQLAEEQFCLSSQIMMLLLQQDLLSDYESTLGIAMQLHVALVFQMNYDAEEARYLFRQVYEQWLGVFRENSMDAEWGLLRKMQAQFEFQKESIVPFIQSLWQALEENEPYEDFWFHYWNRSIQSFQTQFSKVQLNRNESEIVADYIHMINNRLGVSNFDESYLAFLLMRSLEE